ncbi:D-aspartate oxidase isoform X4 [Scyliorhinus torazame]|uniref:D-aspartate oxidase isoform X4 n=1 Tax=Scyliorhinus torazame TaxID=75743 RepID=UPI003B5C0819
MDKIRVAVIGAGVVGLSTAVCVAESVPGCSVTVVAEKFSPQTTSDVAAGVLSPHFSPETPVHRQKRWFEDTFAHVYSIAQTAEAPNIGVQILSGWEIFQEPPVEHIPFWADSVLAFRVMNDAELKRFPQAIFGWMYTTLLCDCTHYLPWLEKRLKNAGGRLRSAKIRDFWELDGTFDIIVNCSGPLTHSQESPALSWVEQGRKAIGARQPTQTTARQFSRRAVVMNQVSSSLVKECWRPITVCEDQGFLGTRWNV